MDNDITNTTVSQTFHNLIYVSNCLMILLNALFISFSFIFAMQIFVGNLDPNVTEEELKQTFLHFGEIVNVKIPVGRGCGFVQFAARFV